MKPGPIEIPYAVQQEIDAGALFVLNHSGGKDSQAMSILLEGVIPRSQILVVHAELPEVDWDGIPAHIESTLPGHAVVYTMAQKTFFSMVEHRFASRPSVPSFPSPSTRQCTSDLKRDPIDRVVRQYLKEHPEFHGRAVYCMGIRAEESSARAKASTWKAYKRGSRAGRTLFHWLPIHGLSTSEVFAIISKAGQRPHWAYAAGMSRLSCCFCIMASTEDLQTAAHLRPALAQRYIQLEKKTGYTMNMSQKPLETIIRKPLEGVAV